MPDLIANGITGYRLLDSGHGRKLEEIAGHLVVRPCVQAIWRSSLEDGAWKRARSQCIRTDDGGGFWRHDDGEPKDLRLSWEGLTFRLRFTAFGHCGVFFEQVPIWQVIRERLADQPRSKFLNLFGYTGCASLVAAQAGAEVFHVDSSKGVLDWGRQNQADSGLTQAPIKWIHEDVRSFLRLSVKRGFRYDAILADPPAWGHGKDKEHWDFAGEVADLADTCRSVLAEGGILIFTSHTPGVQHRALANLLPGAASGELGIAHDGDDRILPAGVFAQAG